MTHDEAFEFFKSWEDYKIDGRFYECSNETTMEEMYQAFVARKESEEQGRAHS